MTLVPGEAYAELVGATCPIYLIKATQGSSPYRDASLSRHYARHWTPIHLDFVVPDLDVALERALIAGATQEGSPTDHAYGRLVLLADPFGHGECLLQFHAQGYDAIAT